MSWKLWVIGCTHGTNQVNFAILHLFGYRFAPRYRDIYTVTTESLYGFRHLSHYTEAMVKPVRKINVDLIVSEWDNIQRIMVSLAQKTTTQSIIIGKLSAHARKNRTKRALWEYDNIIKSLYLLDYIDSPPLRQNVQKALNRGESYHKLRRAIAHANFGKLRFKTEREQQIWNEYGTNAADCSPTASSITTPASFRVCWLAGGRRATGTGLPCWQEYPRWLGRTSTCLAVMSLASL